MDEDTWTSPLCTLGVDVCLDKRGRDSVGLFIRSVLLEAFLMLSIFDDIPCPLEEVVLVVLVEITELAEKALFNRL